ncbi:MAG: PAS domain-containing protein [Proteobacteria bacterium]|nr:PAS domain-containing protein [Pseudomonadota bacterium]MBI3496277.1 PAS domain-containing protein [Pseudomonadota bacterium]
MRGILSGLFGSRTSPTHRAVLFWRRQEAALPPVSAIDPFALKPVLGNLIVLAVLGDGADFRFRLYGTDVAKEARFDWTGNTVNEMRRTLRGPGPAFYLATYRALLSRRKPIYTVNPAMVVFERRAWGRLALPFGDPGADCVERILVGNYVVSQDFVTDEEERRLASLREEMRAQRWRDRG